MCFFDKSTSTHAGCPVNGWNPQDTPDAKMSSKLWFIFLSHFSFWDLRAFLPRCNACIFFAAAACSCRSFRNCLPRCIACIFCAALLCSAFSSSVKTGGTKTSSDDMVISSFLVKRQKQKSKLFYYVNYIFNALQRFFNLVHFRDKVFFYFSLVYMYVNDSLLFYISVVFVLLLFNLFLLPFFYYV